MNKFSKVIVIFSLFVQSVCFANSINLFNDSSYQLKATIYDANGVMLGEFVLNPRDTSEWSDGQNFGSEIGESSQSPYSVSWFCMNGGSYGICENVAAGSIVTAQSCGGVQECPGQQQSQ